MSNHVSSIAQRKVVGSATKKTVLMYLSERASDDGTGIWTSKSHISADTELSKRSVQTAIKEFEGIGILKLVGTRSCKHGFTYEYSIDVDALKLLPSTRERTGAGDSPVQVVHPDGCRRFTPTGAGGAPKPSLEPPLEPSINAHGQDSLFSDTEVKTVKSENYEEAFKEFWAVYPKRVAPEASKKNFIKAIKNGADPKEIIEGARRYAKSRSVAAGYVKNPQGWLTDGRWEDDELEASPPRGGPSGVHRRSEPWGEVVR